MVAPVVAGALGDPFIGVFVGIGLAFLWERDDSPGGLAPLNGAIGSAVGAAVGVSMYERIGLGGVVIEPMTGIVVGALAGLSLQIWDNKREGGEEPATPPLLETLQTAARTSVGSLLGILGCIALWDWDPSFIRNWAPWTEYLLRQGKFC